MRHLEAVLVLLFLARFVSRRAAVLALLVLVTMPAALPAGAAGFASVVPRLVHGMAPWAVLLPFALVRGRSAVLRLALVAALAVETVRPGTLPVTGLVAGVIGAFLDELAGKRPDPLLVLGVGVLGALVFHLGAH